MSALFPRLAILVSCAAGLLSFVAPVRGQLQVELDPAVAEIPEPAPPMRVVARVMRAGVTPRPAEFLRNQPGVNDNVERVLLFGPKGPIIVQATISIDGQPYRVQREKLIQELLEQADTNRDGKSTWEEAIANPRFVFGRFAVYVNSTNAAQRTQLIRQFDTRPDGLVDRDEAETLLARNFAPAAFNLMPGGAAPNNPDLRNILDSNGDGRISSEEVSNLAERLKSRDSNGNELIEMAELLGTSPATALRPLAPAPVRRYPAPTTTPTSILLNQRTVWSTTRASLMVPYGKGGKLVAESFPLMPHIMESLDTNADGELSENELTGLLRIRPHVVMTVNFGKSNVPAGVTVDWTQPLLKLETVAAEMADHCYYTAGVRVRVAKAAETPPPFDYRQNSQLTMNQFDVDKNGYIDQKDIDESPNKQYIMNQFARWDDNGDGKVFAEEIVLDFERQALPQRTQVYLTVTDRAPGLFGLIDLSGDGRLSPRELKLAGERLKSLDKNGDGTLDAEEIPGEIRLQFSQGGSFYNNSFLGNGMVSPRVEAARQTGPKWFVHMDRNGDGDISPREFLGTPEQFGKLDKNADGFLEPAEAKAATPE